MSRFEAGPSGVTVRLPGPELAILSRLGSLLGGAGVGKDDPATERLTPRIYPEDESASREFERLAGKERVEARSADREVFADGLQAAAGGALVLDDDEAAAWLRVIGEARVVVAARKGLFDAGLPTGSVDDPEVALVMFLGLLQEELVGQVLTRMEETT